MSDEEFSGDSTLTSDDLFWIDAGVELASPSDLSLVIDTDSSAGAFFDTILAAAFGVLVEFGSEEAIDVMNEHGARGFDDVVGWIVDVVSTDPRMARVVLYPTPGWTNDGYGNDARVTSDHPFKHHSFRSVRIPLERMLSAEELDGVMARARAFAHDNGITITGFRYVREIVYTQSKGVA